MQKTICDVCKYEMNLSAPKSMSSLYATNFDIVSFGKIWDICPKCRAELKDWLQAREPKNEQNRYAYMRGAKGERE